MSDKFRFNPETGKAGLWDNGLMKAAAFFAAAAVSLAGIAFYSPTNDGEPIPIVPAVPADTRVSVSGQWSIPPSQPVSVLAAKPTKEPNETVSSTQSSAEPAAPSPSTAQPPKKPASVPTPAASKATAAEPASQQSTAKKSPKKTVTKKPKQSPSKKTKPKKTKPSPPKKPTTYSGATIGGFFIYSSTSTQVTNQMLDGIKATGADTVITFGSRLRPVTVNNHTPQATGFTSCVENGKGCLSALYKKHKVNKVFTYEDKEPWSGRALVCSGERMVAADNGDKFTVLVLGRKGNCSKAADLVVIKHPASGKATTELVKGAQKRGMKVILGLPAPIASSKHGWLPDMSYQDTLQRFTNRFLHRTKKDYGTPKTIAGFYHHTEMPLVVSDSWKSVRTLYSMQNKSIKKHFPGKIGLISPYIDARRNSVSPTPLKEVAAATRKLAKTANGVHIIIAPQDGQGTGKVGAYSHGQRNNKVDAPSAAVAGKGTYAQRYYGSTGDYMREVVKGTRGNGVTAWVNIELMTATTTGAPQCQGAPLGRGKADISRVKRQVKIAAVSGVRKTIGFMWQPYATCGANPISAGLQR